MFTPESSVLGAGVVIGGSVTGAGAGVDVGADVVFSGSTTASGTLMVARSHPVIDTVMSSLEIPVTSEIFLFNFSWYSLPLISWHKAL